MVYNRHAVFSVPFTGTSAGTKAIVTVKPKKGTCVRLLRILDVTSATAQDLIIGRAVGLDADDATRVVTAFPHDERYPVPQFLANQEHATAGVVAQTGPTLFQVGTTPRDYVFLDDTEIEIAQLEDSWTITASATPADTAALLLAEPGYTFVWSSTVPLPADVVGSTYYVATDVSKAVAFASMAAKINAILHGAEVRSTATAILIPQVIGKDGISNVTDPVDPGGLITVTPQSALYLGLFATGAFVTKGTLLVEEMPSRR